MHLLQQLDRACPSWRQTVASDPLEAAVELGLIDADKLDKESHGELDFNNERDNMRRFEEYYGD